MLSSEYREGVREHGRVEAGRARFRYRGASESRHQAKPGEPKAAAFLDDEEVEQVLVQRHTDLAEVVLTGIPPRCFTSRLNGRQQQRDQDADDRDYDQQLHKREAGRSR